MKCYKVVLATLLFLSLILHARMLWVQWSHVASGSGDFIAYYTAGNILNSGNIRDLSSFEIQEKLQQQLALPGQKKFVPFYHAPYQALLVAPIARFPYPTARLLWAMLNLALLFIVFVLLANILGSTHKLLDGLILVATYPTWINLMWGHDAILSTLILVAVFGYLKNHREGLAGCMLALGLYKPQLVLPLGAIVLYSRQWKIARTFVIVGLFLLCISVLMLSLQGAFDLVGIVVSGEIRGTFTQASNMPNMKGLVIMFLGSSQLAGLANCITAVISVMLLCGFARLCKDGFGPAYPTLELKFSLALVTTLLINPHSHAYEFVILLAVLILLLDYILKMKPKLRYFRESFLVILSIICIPVIPNVLQSYELISIYVLPLLALYCFIGLEIRKWQWRQAG